MINLSKWQKRKYAFLPRIYTEPYTVNRKRIAVNIEDCFKKELLIRKRPAREKARQSLKAAKVYMKKAKDNIALKNYDISLPHIKS